MLRNSIKEDLKENFILEEEYWQYNKEYIDKIKKIKEDIQLYEEEKEKETIKNNDTDWMNIFKKKEKINEKFDNKYMRHDIGKAIDDVEA